MRSVEVAGVYDAAGDASLKRHVTPIRGEGSLSTLSRRVRRVAPGGVYLGSFMTILKARAPWASQPLSQQRQSNVTFRGVLHISYYCCIPSCCYNTVPSHAKILARSCKLRNFVDLRPKGPDPEREATKSSNKWFP